MKKIIGMCRYSVKAAFAKDHPDKNFSVYEEPYFSGRLDLFQSITLKSFDAQTCKDFVLLVYHSDEMPKDKIEIFKNIERLHPYVRNVFVSDAKMKLPDDLEDNRILTFRIDNDDAMPCNFISKLWFYIYSREDSYCDNVAFTIPKMRRIARIGETLYQTQDCVFISNSMGLAYCSTNGETIMDCGNHTKVPYNYRIQCLEGMGGLQTIHGSNVANHFGKHHYKESGVRLLSESEMQELLISEGFPTLNIQNIPLLKGCTEFHGR